MSYCVALKLGRGLVFMSDTLTNGGLDNISHYPKTFNWGVKHDRQILLATAGNLATSQSVVSLLSEQAVGSDNKKPSILRATSMFQVARIVSKALSEVISMNSLSQQAGKSTFSATFILGGQINGDEPRLYLIYPEGNFIEVSNETPFFQIGETKYGRPILVRAFEPDMSFEDAVKLLMVSFDSTIKANLTVGLPIDIHIYERDSLQLAAKFKIDPDNQYFQMVSQDWGASLKDSLARLPNFDFQKAQVGKS